MLYNRLKKTTFIQGIFDTSSRILKNFFSSLCFKIYNIFAQYYIAIIYIILYNNHVTTSNKYGTKYDDW